MATITIELSAGQAQRFLAACNAKLLGDYIEAEGIEDPTPQQLGEWCFKYLGRKFTLRYERELYDDAYESDPFEKLQ